MRQAHTVFYRLRLEIVNDHFISKNNYEQFEKLPFAGTSREFMI
jgi:hypothetical protein